MYKEKEVCLFETNVDMKKYTFDVKLQKTRMKISTVSICDTKEQTLFSYFRKRNC